MTRRLAVPALILCLLVTFGPAGSGAAAPRPQVSCSACVVVDEDGNVLWGRDAGRPVAVASATKIVTALVVRDSAELGDIVEVSAGAAATPGGKLSLVAGQRLTVEDLLWGLLLNSSNDAAVALAEHIAGSEAAFVAQMNSLAEELGGTATAFATAHGLDAPGHYSSARDMATFGAALLADPVLSHMVATTSHAIQVSGAAVELQNTNELLGRYRGTVGIKTGFTSDAGNVLVAAAERRGRRLISVALGSADHFADSIELLDAGFAALADELLLAEGTAFGWLFIDGAGATEIVTETDINGFRPGGDIDIATRFGDPLTSIVKGASVGSVEVRSDNETLGTSSLIAASSLEAPAPGGLRGLFEGSLRFLATIIPGDDV